MGSLHLRQAHGVARRTAKERGAAHGDRRRSFRVHVPSRATVWSKGELRGQYELRDLSIGGCLLHGTSMRPVGEPAELMLHLPHRPPLALAGHVRRCRSPLLAVSFDAPTPRAEDCIQQLVFEAVSHDHPSALLISLVIEPQPALRQQLVHALREHGQRAVGVGTALDAVQLLAEKNEYIGTAFIQLATPWLPSLELLAFLTDHYPNVRRVLMGAPAAVASVWAAEATGEVAGLLETPVQPDALRRLLAHLGCTLHDAFMS